MIHFQYRNKPHIEEDEISLPPMVNSQFGKDRQQKQAKLGRPPLL